MKRIKKRLELAPQTIRILVTNLDQVRGGYPDFNGKINSGNVACTGGSEACATLADCAP